MKGCRPLTEEEVQAIEQSFTGPFAARDRALFVLGVKSGFRISELLSLRLGDVLPAGRMVDRVTVPRRHMKQKREGRSVLLHPRAQEALAAWLAELNPASDLPDHTFVFRSRKGRNRPITRVQAWRILDQAYASQGLTGTLGTHSLRKTFADRVYDRLEHDLVKTAQALGHHNINSTVSYLSFREEEIDEAIRSI